MNHDGPHWNPTAEEIARACESIRRGWSESERLKRLGVFAPRPWLPPVTRIAWEEFDDRLSGVGTFCND